MSVNILSTQANATSPSDIAYRVTITGFSYTPVDSDRYTVTPHGRAPVSCLPLKYKVRKSDDGSYTLSKYSRAGNATLSGRFKVDVTGDVYTITRRYGSGDLAVYQLVRMEGGGFEAWKAPGYALEHMPGWCREREVAEAGHSFDVGLVVHEIVVHEIVGKEAVDEWDVIGEDEGDEEFVMVQVGDE